MRSRGKRKKESIGHKIESGIKFWQTLQLAKDATNLAFRFLVGNTKGSLTCIIMYKGINC